MRGSNSYAHLQGLDPFTAGHGGRWYRPAQKGKVAKAPEPTAVRSGMVARPASGFERRIPPDNHCVSARPGGKP